MIAPETSVDLIGLDEVRDWSRDDKGNVRHKSGQFFGIEGVRTESGALREVASWDQPIYTQPEGGILGLIAREHAAKSVEFLLNAKAEPGNIGVLHLHSKHLVEYPSRAWRETIADAGGSYRRDRRPHRLPCRT